MELKILSLQELQNVRKHWISCASEQPELSESSLELTEQFFDLIEQNQLYGEFYDRPNNSTYIGLDINNDGKIDVLAELIYFRRARVKTFKIMDIYYSPSIEALTETEYDSKCIHTLVYIVNQFVKESSDAIGGSTKIYARTNTSLKYITQLHNATQDDEIREEFESSGLAVNREGRWLSFRVKK